MNDLHDGQDSPNVEAGHGTTSSRLLFVVSIIAIAALALAVYSAVRVTNLADGDAEADSGLQELDRTLQELDRRVEELERRVGELEPAVGQLESQSELENNRSFILGLRIEELESFAADLVADLQSLEGAVRPISRIEGDLDELTDRIECLSDNWALAPVRGGSTEWVNEADAFC